LLAVEHAMASQPSNAQYLGALREKLLARRSMLADDVGQLADEVKSGSGAPLRSELADVGQDGAEHDFSLSRMASEEDEIYYIDEALQKIHAGTYGPCEECGKPINPERLEALPHARFCIECQRTIESGQG
jgi:RNA polymerase-binding protein DksA